MRLLLSYPLCGLISLHFVSCDHAGNKGSKYQGDEIASVGKEKLYSVDIKNAIPSGMTPEDSTMFASTFIDKWVRESVVLSQAEKTLGDSINIDKLVDDYRKSLLIYHYELAVVEDQLDTVISVDTYQKAYEEQKDQFLLQSPVFYLTYFKIPAKTKMIDRFFSNWRNQRESEVDAYLKKHNITVVRDTSVYYTFQMLTERIGRTLTASQFNAKHQYQYNSDGYEHFLLLEDYKEAGSVAPLDYIRESLRKKLLFDRKKELLKNHKNQLYSAAMLRGDVQSSQ